MTIHAHKDSSDTLVANPCPQMKLGKGACYLSETWASQAPSPYVPSSSSHAECERSVRTSDYDLSGVVLDMTVPYRPCKHGLIGGEKDAGHGTESSAQRVESFYSMPLAARLMPAASLVLPR